jgi:endonuclease/exonuclease/phosphatase family metal-dependent hydrolase
MTRILTLNLNAYGERHGPWSERRPQIVAALREARPDVIALQAVACDPARADGHDQARQLARELDGYVSVYHTAERDEDGRELGIGFLSRRPVLATRAYPLSRRGGEDPFRRVLLRLSVDAPGGPLQLFNAHVSWVGEQARDNLEEALPHILGAEGRVVVLGDFNQTPESEAAERLREVGLVDAWSLLHPDDPGFTFYEGDGLSKRIDYVWLESSLAPRLRAARLVLDEPGARRASDHAGLLVELDAPCEP